MPNTKHITADQLSTSLTKVKTEIDKKKNWNSVNYTILTNDWDTRPTMPTALVYVTGITANSIGNVGLAADATFEQKAEASKVRLVSQGSGYLYFQAKELPTESIPLTINFEES